MTFRFIWVLFFIESLFLSLYASDFHSPRTEGLGGAGRAAPFLSDAIYLNPAFISFLPTHSFSSHYLSYKGGHLLNLSIMDGTRDALFQAGVGFTRREDLSLFHLVGAKQIFSRLGIGIGSKFILPRGVFHHTRYQVDGTISVMGVLNDWFQSAFVVDNIFEINLDQGFYREYILGIKTNLMNIFSFYFDPHVVPRLKKIWGYELGLEFPVMQDFFLRFGTFYNSSLPHESNQRGSGYGLGFGWIGPKISFDYSFSQTRGLVVYQVNNFGMTIFF